MLVDAEAGEGVVPTGCDDVVSKELCIVVKVLPAKSLKVFEAIVSSVITLESLAVIGVEFVHIATVVEG